MGVSLCFLQTCMFFGLTPNLALTCSNSFSIGTALIILNSSLSYWGAFEPFGKSLGISLLNPAAFSGYGCFAYGSLGSSPMGMFFGLGGLYNWIPPGNNADPISPVFIGGLPKSLTGEKCRLALNWCSAPPFFMEDLKTASFSLSS